MRRTSLGLLVFGLAACNAIWGNEDHYTLVDDTAAAGDVGEAGSVGRAGNAAKAGASGHAGRAAIGEGGLAGDDAGSGGVAEAGEGGSGGGGSCVPSGAEDCFNGKDDDCDGATDCEDPLCTASTECVPSSAGELGTLLDSGSTCPTGYSAVTLHRGLSADPYCAGCTCGVDSTYCTTSIVGHGSFACPGFQTSGLSYNMYNTSCQPISPGTSVHFYAVASFTSCSATGTATPSPVEWAETRTYCKADHVGRGCASGSSCVPKASGPACTRKAGDTSCSGAYATATGAVWNGGVTDDRTCSTCQCSGGYGTCDGAGINVYSDGSCAGTPTALPGTQGDSCPLPFAPASGRVVGTPVPVACVNSTYASGTVEAASPSTVCCQ